MNVKFYHSTFEKKQLIKNAMQKGESVIHDDFLDEFGKTTDGKSGRLSFDIISTEINRRQKMSSMLKFWKRL